MNPTSDAPKTSILFSKPEPSGLRNIKTWRCAIHKVPVPTTAMRRRKGLRMVTDAFFARIVEKMTPELNASTE